MKAMPAVCRHTVVGIKESKKHLAELKKLYDTLIESLVGEAGRNGGPARVISVTSCRQGEGSSTVAMHLALILSSCSKGRVLLVDANFEHPSVHETFGAQPFPGLAEVKAAEGSFAALTKPSGVENLDLLCSGKADDDLAWLFESKSFDLFLSLGKREYSFVLFDTPPVWGGAHATCLDSAADAVILVIEAERVRWETAQRARDRLVDAGANVVGVVLNKRRFHVPGWLYRTL